MFKSIIKKRNPILIISLSFLLISTTQSYADSGTENSYLARINQVLSSLKPLINKADHAANKNARLKFHYDWLRADITQMQQGIQQKINDTNIEPRPIQPLKGDYVSLESMEGAAMTPAHANAFYEASGIHAASLAWDLRLFVGGLALVCSLLIIIGLVMAIGTSDSPLEKTVFILSLLVLAVVLMLIFTYIA